MPASRTAQIEVREATKAHLASRQKYEVPAHLKGVLFSPMDCFEHNMRKADAEFDAYFAARRAAAAEIMAVAG